MTINHICYKSGYKYQLTEDYLVDSGIKPISPIRTEFITLTTGGMLLIKHGYAWDGASGPTWDDDSNMRGSLGHDALYQLMRLGLLSGEYKTAADQLLREWCIEDGMWSARADAWFWAVDKFGGSNVLPKNAKKIHVAPKKFKPIAQGC